MTTLIESKASRQIYSDGKLVDDMGINATFDGNILDMQGYKNENEFYTKLNREEALQLLAIQSSPIPLDKRLIKDFNIHSRTNKYSKKSTNKSSSKKSTRSKSKTSNKSKKTKTKTKTKIKTTTRKNNNVISFNDVIY